jgi:hypothetical protein
VGVTTFFHQLLEHLFLRSQLEDQRLESLDGGFEFADASGVIGLGRVVPLSPAMVGWLADAVLAASIGNGQPGSQIPVEWFPQSPNLVRCSAFLPESLRGLF